MISIIDYGMGNLRSVEKGLSSQGAEVRLTRSASEIMESDGVVLPGVGAFGDCVKNLQKFSLTEPIREYILSGRPFLGICLGLQVLFESSEESPDEKGLSLFKGKVLKFPVFEQQGLKVPHMGWNRVKFNIESRVMNGIPTENWFYFVHSYYVDPEDNSLEILSSDYGMNFTAGIIKDNVFAFQFHPEKSSDLGLRILKNFSEICKN